MTVDARPLHAGELLDRTFTMLRGHFGLFVGIAAIPLGSQFLIVAVLRELRGPLVFHSRAGMLGDVMGIASIGMLVNLVIFGALNWATSRLWLGQSAAIGESYRATAGRIPSLMGALVLAWLALTLTAAAAVFAIAVVMTLLRVVAFTRFLAEVFLGVQLAVAMAVVVWIGVGLALAQPAIVLERLGPLEGLRRGWRLSQGGRWHVVMVYGLYLALAMLLVSLTVFPFTAPLFIRRLHGWTLPYWVHLAGGALNCAGMSVLLPIFAIGLTLVYMNQRVVKEGFDLQVMLDEAAAPDPLVTADPDASAGVGE